MPICEGRSSTVDMHEPTHRASTGDFENTAVPAGPGHWSAVAGLRVWVVRVRSSS